jgi:hypothetical protein
MQREEFVLRGRERSGTRTARIARGSAKMACISVHAGELAALREEVRMANTWTKEVSETVSRQDMHRAQ